jgi:hypothetical protein
VSQEQMTASEWARRNAALRAQVTRQCAVCGTEFTGTTRRLYCSPACAHTAYRQRNRAELAARSRQHYHAQKTGAPPSTTPPSATP